MEEAETKIKVQDRVINYLRGVVDNLEKDNMKLQEKVEYCDCRKYNKSMHEVVQAATKHKEKIFELDKLLITKKAVLKACRENMDELSNENDVLKQEIKSKEHKVSIVQTKHKHFDEEKEASNSDLITLKNEIEVSHSVMTSQRGSIHKLEEKNMLLDEKIVVLENEIGLMIESTNEKMEVIKRELEMKNLKFHEVVDKNKSQELKIDEQEQTIESLQEEKIISLKKNKDLEDEIEIFVKIKENNENLDLLKSSSSSLEDELNFENKKNKMARVQNEKDKLTEKMAHLSANNEESLELLKSKIKGLKWEIKLLIVGLENGVVGCFVDLTIDICL